MNQPLLTSQNKVFSSDVVLVYLGHYAHTFIYAVFIVALFMTMDLFICLCAVSLLNERFGTV